MNKTNITVTTWDECKSNYYINHRDSIFRDAIIKKGILQDRGVKVGVVITTSGNNGIFVSQAIESFIRELPNNNFIILYINESVDPATLAIADKFPGIKVVYVKDQNAEGGLTGTWNKGIKQCLQSKCDIIVLANDDILFDCSVNHILYSAYRDNSTPGKIFCPVTNAPGPLDPIIGTSCPFNRQQLSPGPRNESDYELLVNNTQGNCNGFFMVFPKETLKSNKFNGEYFFNPKFPFGGNEVEWCKRFITIGGKISVVPRHLYTTTKI